MNVSEIDDNYKDAFRILSNSDVPKNWYMDEATNTEGLIWHFTDINNMANILSFMQIQSKNFAQQNNLIKNDNAAKKVNDELTKHWVHDYARFYLHPKTPTQYRNEGIFEYSAFNKLLNSRLLANGQLWTDRPAHLPVPVFICFSLKDSLEKGGFITKRSLAGRSVSDDMSQMVDKNLDNFRKNVLKIYGDKSARNCEKQTEFIIKDSLSFNPNSIIKIIVRSDAEKLALLTLLEEHNAQYFSSKEQHQRIDIIKYIDKIVVDESVFFNDAGKLIMIDGCPKEKNLYLKKLDKIKFENVKIESNKIEYDKIINDSMIGHVRIAKLKKEVVKVLDINSEEKVVGVFHNPDWILTTQNWKNKRYYSNIYYNYKYFQLWRANGQNYWHLKNNQLFL